jgi:hypothetical protein
VDFINSRGPQGRWHSTGRVHIPAQPQFLRLLRQNPKYSRFGSGS